MVEGMGRNKISIKFDHIKTANQFLNEDEF